MTSEQKNILGIYIAFLIAIILNFVPSASLQAFGGLLLMLAVITAYVYRRKSKDGSVMKDHMQYLIKTFWISTLFIGLGIILAYIFGDHSVIYALVDQVKGGQILDPQDIESVMHEYGMTNMVVFAATLLPGMFYFIYRVIKGIIKVKNSDVLTTGWF